MTINKFIYVNYANDVVATNLLYWQDKIQRHSKYFDRTMLQLSKSL